MVKEEERDGRWERGERENYTVKKEKK